jgi:hypothetical protein
VVLFRYAKLSPKAHIATARKLGLKSGPVFKPVTAGSEL